MAIKVLVVDDSSFFRRRLTEILTKDGDIELVDTAVNGQEAVDKALALKPDVITMDVEMPVLDGISAVRQIMQQQRIPILMFSSLTHEGAKATLDALEAGAVDFLPKKFEDIARDKDEAGQLLRDRVRAVARKRQLGRPTFSSTLGNRTESLTAKLAERPALTRSSFERPKLSERVAPGTSRFQPSGKQYKLVAIGTSTGGPVALQRIITALPANFPLPIVLIQHMPAAFTGAFAQRLNSLAKVEVREAQDNDVLRPGVAYLAPGGKQMLIEGSEREARLRIKEDDSARITFKPSVDITFATAAKVYADKVLAIVLTGMGADGREGARLLKQLGARIWAQDEASCVVYGMPQAIAAAGLMDVEVSLNDVATKLVAEVTHG
ncbi:chemotaxis response regulator protein-glutamate methylesterase [Rheinheimera muenzenbergensis]|uniref:Protein-glutamate methylesterase/protein-glutamine glutaminase n=1 Tax=Rheinheimera muenzenbergensis TaxID=1193628 RepID=A0ABU8C1X3_9GAMM|nr:chemotaxis response regulator protein-glutamate methylesterase [Gammaproteobacteria bacterium]MBU1553220.1 chemotaxis response regulator protein-glutamate methylesterase [Gammaproteobacteria bacterium]MBU2069613.1 chemotaxis response regulator protein-glutamate methylesterase [Gammaproteobacteria bacterium]MBU2184478.1 chemotaxis response regulator protein-glutamate methylesterase [Gammaproteobacteria bacterium]MBU2205160.1 chemotaxis response regulator protein-glutamate methylesterase [Gamm